jgi:hypothetical protein
VEGFSLSVKAQNNPYRKRRKNMTPSFSYRVMAFFLMFLGLGMSTANAGPIDLLGKWGGTANIATDAGFSSSSVSLDILAQQGVGFSGTMQFGNDDSFNVNGVVDKLIIRITSSSSIFEAIVFGQGINEAIHGLGSRLETTEFPSATVVFDLHTAEYNCLHSGGSVSTGFCCASVSDFPNTCGIGACGCPPPGSHQIKTCHCGANKCFDGIRCVSPILLN